MVDELAAFAALSFPLILHQLHMRSEQGIANLGEYYAQIALVSAGFSSLKELEDRIQSQVRQIRETVSTLNWLVGQREWAQALYDTAVSEGPKK